MGGSVLALLMLCMGVCLAAASSVAPARLTFGNQARAVAALSPAEGTLSASSKVALTSDAADASREAAHGEGETSPVAGKFLKGVICAIGCGLLNGSLMVPVTCFQNGSTLLGVTAYSGTVLAPIAFLPSL